MKEEAESKQMNKWKGFDFSVNWGNAFKGSANERKNSGVWGLTCLRGKQGIITFSKIIHSSSNKRTLQSFISAVPVIGFKMGSLTNNKEEESLRLLLIYLLFLLCEIRTCTASALYEAHSQVEKLVRSCILAFVLAKLCKRCFPTHQSAADLLNCKTGLSFFPTVSCFNLLTGELHPHNLPWSNSYLHERLNRSLCSGESEVILYLQLQKCYQFPHFSWCYCN